MASESWVSSTITSICFSPRSMIETRLTLAGCSAFSAKVVIFRVLDDVDLFAAQLANDGLHAHALHADAGADAIDIPVAALHGDLGALAGLARDGLDARPCRRKSPAPRSGTGSAPAPARRATRSPAVPWRRDRRAAGRRGRARRRRTAPAGSARASASCASALPRSKITSMRLQPLHRGRKHLAGAVGVLVEDRIALSLANLLEDDLLGHLRGDAAQRSRCPCRSEALRPPRPRAPAREPDRASSG